MARIAAKTKRYPSDLTDEEWAAVEPLLSRPAKRGRKRKTDLRMVRSGCERRSKRCDGDLLHVGGCV